MRTPLEMMKGIATEQQGVFDEPDVKLIRNAHGVLVNAETGEVVESFEPEDDGDEEGGETK